MGTTQVIKIRREKVALLTLQGFSASQIAPVMKVKQRTIEKDRQIHREEWAKKFKTQPFDKALYNFIMQRDATFKEAWKLMEATNNDNVKLGCINTINRSTESKIKVLQSLGVIDQAADKLEVSGNLSVQGMIDVIKKAREEKEQEEN